MPFVVTILNPNKNHHEIPDRINTIQYNTNKIIQVEQKEYIF